MERLKRTQVKVRRDSGIPYKGGTPVRLATRRRERYKRLLTRKCYDTLPERIEEEEINEPKLKPVSPVSASAPLTKNRRSQPASCVASVVKASGQQNVSGKVSPTVTDQLIPEVKRCGGTPESGTSCVMEAESTLNSEEDDDDDDNYDSDDDDDYDEADASTTISNSSSPEIFRKERSVDTMTFPSRDDLLQVKNSTLLEDSRAENIHSHHQPNLSTIIDASLSLAEEKCEISYHKTPEDEGKLNISASHSDQAFKKETSPKRSERKPITFRKKVRFKSLDATEIQNEKEIKSPATSGKNTSSSSRPLQKIKPDPMTSRRSETSFKAQPLPLAVKRPGRTCSEKASFFRFVNDDETRAFLHKMKETSVKLRSAVFFPFKSGVQTSE
ncbi:U1 small nuclear ribonucleoprotein component SNU71 isoform X2 [Poecilia reticulata]|uniref:U1 small nuclear ribonucleoprotein component SNU71 isoform X2 n=1 Tax=Poecilia reticulata TaxID=8081 RepID=UPI0004A248DA|nr:PREDICTED: U1 small nuclear ribonucleoprotein component SNU71-like isoform X2 [Poecilia reticulata]